MFVLPRDSPPRSWGEMCQAGSAMSLPLPLPVLGTLTDPKRRYHTGVAESLGSLGYPEGQLHSLGTRVSLGASGIILPGTPVFRLDPESTEV